MGSDAIWIDKRCARKSLDTQLRNEALMLRIVSALSEEAVLQARTLFREYSTLPGVAPCVADFEKEVASLPGAYLPPGGRLLLAIQENAGRPEDIEEAIGCVALRKLDQDSCEMKRLYVRPAYRGLNAGRELVNELITQAKWVGYKKMLLDTLPTMTEAHKLYRALGFREISSYQRNPIAGALFFELSLR